MKDKLLPDLPKGLYWASIGFLLILDILLLLKFYELRIENRKWKSKVVLSLSDQRSLYEHGLEGENLSREIELLAKKSATLKSAQITNGLRMIYIFGMACDSCLKMEIDIYRSKASELKSLNVIPIMVFGNIDEDLFGRLVSSLDINEITIRDKENILIKRFSKITTPIILLVNSRNHIMAANLSDYRDPNKSIRFYEKVSTIATQVW